MASSGDGRSGDVYAKRYYRLVGEARLADADEKSSLTPPSSSAITAETFGRDTACFAYGTDLYDRGHLAERLKRFGLKPDGYILYVSRMEPRTTRGLSCRHMAEVKTDLPLVMVGDAPYATEYISEVKSEADERVRFLGYRFGDDYHALQANALIYVQATEVGGTHPALVEALGHRNAILAHDVREHREVLGQAGAYFGYRDAADLADKLAALIADPSRIEQYRNAVARRVADRFGWMP